MKMEKRLSVTARPADWPRSLRGGGREEDPGMPPRPGWAFLCQCRTVTPWPGVRQKLKALVRGTLRKVPEGQGVRGSGGIASLMASAIPWGHFQGSRRAPCSPQRGSHTAPCGDIHGQFHWDTRCSQQDVPRQGLEELRSTLSTAEKMLTYPKTSLHTEGGRPGGGKWPPGFQGITWRHP